MFERFLKTNRQFLSFITISRLLGTYNFNINNRNFDYQHWGYIHQVIVHCLSSKDT